MGHRVDDLAAFLGHPTFRPTKNVKPMFPGPSFDVFDHKNVFKTRQLSHELVAKMSDLALTNLLLNQRSTN